MTKKFLIIILISIISFTFWLNYRLNQPLVLPDEKPPDSIPLIVTSYIKDIKSISNWVNNGEIKKGDNLVNSLIKSGIKRKEANHIVNGLKGNFDFSNCRPGQKFSSEFNISGELIKFILSTKSGNNLILLKNEKGEFQLDKTEDKIITITTYIAGTLKSTFSESVQLAGEHPKLAYMLAEGPYKYDINFVTDPREGDKFEILFEKKYINGKFNSYGKILLARYYGSEIKKEAFWFEKGRFEGFFDNEGRSLKKTLLRLPLDFARITSRYGRRFHPTLKKSKRHLGIDYGTKTGTRVRTVANGVVVYAGKKGAYGNLVVIDHRGTGLKSKYAHLSRFKVKKGQKVKQGQTIALSGNTGRSTGPHLHFEIIKNGRHINPAKMRMEPGKPIPKKQRKGYFNYLKELKKNFKSRMLNENDSNGVISWDKADEDIKG